MTCTHAAMMRRKFIDLGFKFDSIVMEEAGQILEIETLIPLLLQSHSPMEKCRLKRLVLIGDHHQLPPIIQHPALSAFSRFDQSMFTRFIRIGVPHITLDRQGRARPELADLYRWRYTSRGAVLGDLPCVMGGRREYNPGFELNYQLVDVPGSNFTIFANFYFHLTILRCTCSVSRQR